MKTCFDEGKLSFNKFSVGIDLDIINVLASSINKENNKVKVYKLPLQLKDIIIYTVYL